MGRIRRQTVWTLVACVAVAVPVAPPAACRACDRSCAIGQVGDHHARSSDTGVGAVHCPVCATPADCRQADATERPCHCLLTARQDRSPLPGRGGPPSAVAAGAACGLAVMPPEVPRVLGVSREYVMALLAVPIRPLRILFGVWRD